MSEASGLTYCPSVLVPESKLSHGPEVQYSLVPRLSPHKWKNSGSVEPEKPEMTNADTFTNANHVAQVVISFESGRQWVESGRGCFAVFVWSCPHGGRSRFFSEARFFLLWA